MDSVLTVTEVTQIVRRAIAETESLARILVRGEVSNVSRPASGHLYFTLKDERSRIKVVMFAGKARSLRFSVQDGMSVIAGGSVDVFERSGDYQLYAELLQPDGLGALYLAAEQLKERLSAEGLFDAGRKRPLPVYPGRVALVTSPTGAAVRDMITTLRRRYPLAHVLVVPVAVQGDDAPRQIAQGIRAVSEGRLADVMIVGRGGGSFEELYAFSTELVARAAADSEVPVVSAVGHETDVSVLDFVADVRAATPTAAAELISRDQRDIESQLSSYAVRMRGALRSRLDARKRALERLSSARALNDPLRPIAVLAQRVDMAEMQLRAALTAPVKRLQERFAGLEIRLARRSPADRLLFLRAEFERLAMRHREAARRLVQERRMALTRGVERLNLLNPLAVMRRGYAAVFTADRSRLFASVDQVQPGDAVRVEMADGWLDCQVWGVHGHERKS